MKKTLRVFFAVSFATTSIAQDVGQNSSVAASRTAHETVWQRVAWATNQLGGTVVRTNEFVEIATALNYYDETTREWQPSRQEWEVYPDAIVARSGQHKVILSHNLNLAGAVDVLTPDGVTRLISSPVSLGFYDPVDGKQVVLAEVKDCTAERGEAVNEIVFRNCFDRIRGSIRYLYTKAGVHQHVVLEQKLELPEGFSERSRLECYTVYDAATPWPQITTRVLRREKDPVLRALMVEPDFTDSELDFGSMAMRAGTAFSLGDEETTRSIRVGKQFRMIGGQPVLIEAVEFAALAPLLARLASVGQPDTGGLAVNSSRQVKRTKEQARLPREHFRAWDKAQEIQLASNPLREPAVVVDYELLQSATNQVLASDKTWFVSGLVNLSGTTRIEGGAVIKFTNSSSAKINVNGPIDCRTGPYRPAIFTSQYDSSVGDAIGTGTATNYPAALVINTTGNALHDLRFSYATNAVTLGFSAGQLSLTNVQFVNCQYPIDSTGNDENTILVDNALIHLAKYGIRGGRDLIVRGQHLTAHQCEKFAYSPSGGDSYAYLTNCLLMGVTNWGSDFTITTNSTVYYASDVGGVFQTVAAGHHYLLAGSTNRDLGTTNISASLLAMLTKKTTYAPLVLSNVSTTVSTNLLPQAPRDTNNLPDLGFHYDPIDWLTHWYTVSNATLTVSDGVAIACYNDTGVWMADGSSIVSTGTPLAPNWFTRYSLVQEQSLALGSDVGLAVNSYHYSSNAPTGNFRFTRFTGPAGDGYHLYHSDDFAFSNLTVRDCEFWNGFSYFSGSSSLAGTATLNNNLFYRSRPWAQNTTCQQTLTLSNNLVVGAWAAFYGPASDLWKVYDNAFEACTFFSSSRPITNGYNAYINCSTNRLNPTNAHDLVLSSLAWQSGLLGDFYQPTNSSLINTGSLTSAASGGLYHYATTTNQVKESNSTLDIGYHYVALSNGLPVDTDGDSQADYFEDTNGNGLFETTTDFGDWTNYLYAITTFAGVSFNQDQWPGRPDTMGAIGSDHFMEVINGAVAIYARSNGLQVAYTNLDDFLRVTVTNLPFAGTYPQSSNDAAADPRVVFDHVSQRWFVCGLDIKFGHVLMAVSKNGDPIGDGSAAWISNKWNHYLLPMGWRPATNITDQPSLAVDGNGVYIACYAQINGAPGTANGKLRIAALPKEPFLDFSAPTVQMDFIFDNPTNTTIYATNSYPYAQPALNYDSVTTNDPVWFVGKNFAGDTNLYYNQLKWMGGLTNRPEFLLSDWGKLSVNESYHAAYGMSPPEMSKVDPIL